MVHLCSSCVTFYILLALSSQTFCYDLQNLQEDHEGRLQLNSEPKIRRHQRSGCCPRVSIRNCNANSTLNPIWMWKRRYDLKFSSNVQKGCKSSTLKYSWSLQGSKDNMAKRSAGWSNAVLYIFRYTLTPGKYLLSLTVTEINHSSCTASAAQCTVHIEVQAPIANIYGGSRRTAPAEDDLIFRALVLDYNRENADLSNFKFHWFCAYGNETACKIIPYGKDQRAYIEAKNVIDKNIFKITLNVTNDFGITSTATQEVEVRNGTEALQIICLKNCFGTINSDDVSVFRGLCNYDYCDNYGNFVWKFDDINSQEDVKFLTNSKKDMSTVYGSLKPHTTYKVRLSYYNESDAFAELLMDSDYVDLGDCNIKPKERKHLFTLFKVTCKNSTGGALYQLYQVYTLDEVEYSVILATEVVPHFEVYLGSGEIFFDIYGASGQRNIFQVKAFPISPDEKVDIWAYAKNNLATLIQHNDQERAVQIVNCLRDTIADDEVELKKFGFYVMKKFKDMPMYAIQDVLQLATLIGRFTLPGTEADPVYQGYLASSCVDIARRCLRIIVREGHRKQLNPFANKFQSYLDVCSEYAFNDKYTEKQTNSSESDDYANYDDLEVAYRREEFVDATHYGLQIVSLGAGIVAITLNIEQIMFTHNTKNYYSTSTLKYRMEKSTLTHSETNITLESNPLFDSYIAFAAIEYRRNLFWWSKYSEQYEAHITDVNVINIADGSFHEHPDNLRLNFKITAKNVQVLKGSISTPGSLGDWIPQNIDPSTVVYRFDTIPSTNLVIKFDTDKEIQVVILVNRRPEMDDFDRSYKISKKSNILIIPNTVGEGWFYVAMLPHKKYLANELSNATISVEYTIKYALQSCRFWDKSAKQWSTRGCETLKPESPFFVNCHCNHLSAFIGIAAGTKTKEDTILIIPIELEMKYTYTIPIITIISLIIYFVLLIVGEQKTKPFDVKEKIYFLADNAKDDRYAYLLIVKTRNSKDAGTTSNVFIKMFGSRSTSQVHILNYPDPQKRLLQRNNEDWFILTTNRHLGDLLQIELRFDCIGMRPSWYCDYVRIYDLQLHNEWLFNVLDELTVLKEHKTGLKVVSEIPLESGEWKDKLKAKMKSYKAAKNSWNIFKYTHDFKTYLRRITILFSMIWMIFAIDLFIIASPSLQMKDGMDYGHFSIHPIIFIGAFVSSIIAYFLHLGIQFLFQRFGGEIEDKTRRNRNIFLTWTGLLSLVVINLTLLIVFGFWVPFNAVLFFVISVCMAILLILIVYENLYMLIKAAFFTNIEKESNKYNIHLIIEEIEAQRLYLYKKFGHQILRPYLSFKYEPLTQEKIREKTLKETTRQEIGQLFAELIVFSLFVLFLLLILNGTSSFELRRSDEQIKRSIHRGSNHEFGVNKYSDIYTYLNKTLIPNLHPGFWYDGFDINGTNLLKDAVNKLMGVAKLRQKRVVDNVCTIPRPFDAFNMTCVPEYEEYYVGSFPEMLYAGTMKYVWQFEEGSQIESLSKSFLGDIKWYTDSGFVAKFGRNEHNSMYVVNYLKESNWIDHNTRVVLLKFWTYSANDNIFNSVRIIFEKSATGLFINTYNIYSARLFASTYAENVYYYTITFVFGLINLKLLIILLKKAFAFRLNTFRNFWNLFDITIIVLTVVLAFFYVHRYHVVSELINEIDTSPITKYISFSTVRFYSHIITILSALLICLAIIRLWKYLRFGYVFRVMETTLLEIRYPIFIIFLYHLVILLAFTFSGFVLFGATRKSFRNLQATFTTLVLMSLNLFYLDVHRVFADGIAAFYFAFYTIFMLAIYTLYIAIIVLHYSKSSEKLSGVREVYTIKDYVLEEWSYWTELLKVRYKKRLAGGQDLEKIVYPKELEHRYADCLAISRDALEFMSLVARGVIKNLRHAEEIVLTARELQLMLDVARYAVKKGKKDAGKEFFYKARHGGDIELIAEGRILLMEQLTKIMFKTNEAARANYGIIEGPNNAERLQYIADVLQSISNILRNIVFVVKKD